MKKYLVLTSAFIATLTSAFAADLPRARRSIPSTVMSPVPVARQATPMVSSFWNGGYVGAHLGYGFKNSYPNSAFTPSGGSGIIGGLQAGYDWQFSRLVVGLAGDASLTSMSRSAGTVRGDVDWNGSLRARAGFLATNRMLLYVTGGYALGGVKMADSALNASQRQTLHGYTIGAGAEYAFTQNLAAFLEYRYTSLNGKAYSSLANANYGANFNTIRAGLNYRF